MGPPEDFQRSHHPYVAEAEESKLMPWRITDRMWRFFVVGLLSTVPGNSMGTDFAKMKNVASKL